MTSELAIKRIPVGYAAGGERVPGKEKVSMSIPQGPITKLAGSSYLE
jgi:hypothetical protein